MARRSLRPTVLVAFAVDEDEMEEPYDAAVTQTHYDVLGVSRSASAAQVRRAYLDLARRHHPDFHTRTGGAGLAAAEREMQRINEAWLVLGDPQRRRSYDLELHDREPAPPVWDPRGGQAHPDFVPLHDDDDEDGAFGGLDPEAEDDAPYRGARPVARWQQLLPVGLLLAAIATMLLGLVVNLPPLLGLGAAMLVVAGVSFLLTPMFAVMRGYDPNPDK